MLSVTPAEKSEITHIVCPYCKEKVARVGLDKTGHSLCCSHIARCFFGTPSGGIRSFRSTEIKRVPITKFG